MHAEVWLSLNLDVALGAKVYLDGPCRRTQIWYERHRHEHRAG